MADDPRTTNPEGHRGYGYGGAGGGYEHEQQYGEAIPAAGRRTSWGAIIAGTVVALVVYLMLSLLGIGIGATQIDPAAGAAAVPEGLGIGAAVWWVLSVLIALFIGGWFAGYLSGIPEKRDGAIHGIVTWGLAMLLTAWFATTAVGAVTAGAWNVVEGGMAAMEQQFNAAQVGQAQVDQAQQAVAEAQEEVTAIADDVAEAVAHAGIWGFVALLLGAIVAAVGGLVGAIQTHSRTYVAYPGGERREEREPRRREREREREREYEPGRYDYERAERERAERERREREATLGREPYEREREPGEREREEQRERLERERAERERQQRDQS